jgi:hypothetical protein
VTLGCLSFALKYLAKAKKKSFNKMPRQPLWLRCEKKEFERRAALTPTTAKKLIDTGFDITVERDPQRIFDDEEYEKSVPILSSLLEHFFLIYNGSGSGYIESAARSSPTTPG